MSTNPWNCPYTEFFDLNSKYFDSMVEAACSGMVYNLPDDVVGAKIMQST